MTATMKDSILLKLLARVGGENSIAHIIKKQKKIPTTLHVWEQQESSSSQKEEKDQQSRQR